MILCSFFLVACGPSGSGSPWLISMSDTTLTVSDVSKAWTELTQEQRSYFTNCEDPSREFVLSLARKHIVIDEIQAMGYLDRSDVIDLGNAWARMNASLSVRDSITACAGRTVTRDDIQFFSDHMGKTVWYTIDPGTEMAEEKGPSHLPELPRQLAMHLDTMEQGEILPLSDGTPIECDSVVVTDPQLVEATRRDTARVADLATERYTSQRSKEMTEDIADSILAVSSPRIDSLYLSSLADYFADGTGPDLQDTAIVSNILVMTGNDLVQEINFYGRYYPINPSSRTWLLWFAGITLYNDALAYYYQSRYPDDYGQLLAGRDLWLLDIASNLLFQEQVSDSISVSEDDLAEEFQSLDRIPVIPETRSLQCVAVSIQDTAAYNAALSDGDGLDSLISRCNYWRDLSDDDPPTNVTRPLLPREVPGNHGDIVFEHSADDTLNWSQLLPVFEGTMYMAYRLVRVVPPHQGSFRELRDDLENRIMVRRIDARTESWLQQLQEKYSLRLNETALDSLPQDPGDWSG